MLAGLRPKQLAAMTLPLGELTKEQTRTLAVEFGLGVAGKPDSMDLCFVDGDYRGFIERRFPDACRPGPIVGTDGSLLGMHDGLLRYTVGQRKGLPATLPDGPWYIVAVDADANSITIGRREDLERRSLRCSAANVIRRDVFKDGACEGLAMCRYRAHALPARVRRDGENGLQVELGEALPVVTPGQLMVLYDRDGDEVLLSGIIEP